MFTDNSPKTTAQKLKMITPINKIFLTYLENLYSKNFFTSQSNVLTHNDMIHGNILWNLEKKKYQLIDFEYTGFTLMGADIINLCLESAYEYDTPKWPFFEREFPLIGDDEHMKKLIRFYLAYFKLCLVKRAKENKNNYAEKIPKDILENLNINIKNGQFEDEVFLLDTIQDANNLKQLEKSKVFLSVDDKQIWFVKK
jgi:thiamine kinase-like enzyme